ncbi:MAG: hypothetical protein AB1714_05880 [Acidobacteriota bacterium]
MSLHLASYTVVDAGRPLLDDMVSQFVDVLIANEEEARAFGFCVRWRQKARYVVGREGVASPAARVVKAITAPANAHDAT